MNNFQLGIIEKIANDQVINTTVRRDARAASDMRTTDMFVPSDDNAEKNVATSVAQENYDPKKQLINSVQKERLHALFQKARR
jgi:hypothetical protein